MFRKILFLLGSLIVVFLISRAPIFPLIVEVRETIGDVESLRQTWEFMSLPRFYAAGDLARAAWMNETWNSYKTLFVLNHAFLLAVFYECWVLLNRWLGKKA